MEDNVTLVILLVLNVFTVLAFINESTLYVFVGVPRMPVLPTGVGGIVNVTAPVFKVKL
jgi:hypothetical protein